MHLPITHELSIAFSGADPQAVKEHVKTWLAQNGEETFVEGVLDGIDVDFEYGLDDRDYYGELGGALAPIIIYKYDNEYLLALRARMEAAFGSTI